MKHFIVSVLRSFTTFIISGLIISLSIWGAAELAPMLFQDSMWAKIGILSVGIEIAWCLMYMITSACTVTVLAISGKSKTAMIAGVLPLMYGVVRYPWWFISVINEIPVSLGFWNWIIVIGWLSAWIFPLVISIGVIIGNAFESKEDLYQCE